MSRGRGRPRDETVSARAIGAAQDLLIEKGFDGLTIDEVAERAGLSKTTLYRRWPGKEELVSAAVAAFYTPPPVPDTGDLRSDLIACARTYIIADGRSRHALAVLLSAMGTNAALREKARAIVGDAYGNLFTAVLQRASSRGQLPRDADVAIVAEIFPAAAFHRLAVFGQSVDEAYISRIIDNVILPAARQGGAADSDLVSCLTRSW